MCIKIAVTFITSAAAKATLLCSDEKNDRDAPKNFGKTVKHKLLFNLNNNLY